MRPIGYSESPFAQQARTVVHVAVTERRTVTCAKAEPAQRQATARIQKRRFDASVGVPVSKARLASPSLTQAAIEAQVADLVAAGYDADVALAMAVQAVQDAWQATQSKLAPTLAGRSIAVGVQCVPVCASDASDEWRRYAYVAYMPVFGTTSAAELYAANEAGSGDPLALATLFPVETVVRHGKTRNKCAWSGRTACTGCAGIVSAVTADTITIETENGSIVLNAAQAERCIDLA